MLAARRQQLRQRAAPTHLPRTAAAPVLAGPHTDGAAGAGETGGIVEGDSTDKAVEGTLELTQAIAARLQLLEHGAIGFVSKAVSSSRGLDAQTIAEIAQLLLELVQLLLE